MNDNDDDDARFHADLARAISDSKANASPTTSIISLSTDSDSDHANGPAAPAVPVQSTSIFLTERAQLEQERLARLKRLRGDSSEDSHRTVPPPPKRSTPSRTTNCASASQEEVAEEEEFWDGELRQTANKHVEPRRNGEDGKPVFRLSQIIGDVRLAFFITPNTTHSNEAPDHRNHR